MFHCSICGRALSEKEALVHQGKDGKKEIICPACFEKEVGIDYETFRYRRENAKQTFFAVSSASAPPSMHSSRRAGPTACSASC